MSHTQFNIDNLTSLWQTIGQSFDSYFETNSFNYSAIANTQWPNKLWFNQDINTELVQAAKERLLSNKNQLSITYWNIHSNDSFQLLEQHGFSKKFEQIGMYLHKTDFFDLPTPLNLQKVTSLKDAKLWSALFSASFGYEISPETINKSYKNTTFYIAYDLDTPIGTGILHLTETTAGIHSVGIIPSQRRKGYAEKIMKSLINLSIEQHQTNIYLQASDMGKGLYLKLGFEEQFTIKNYHLI